MKKKIYMSIFCTLLLTGSILLSACGAANPSQPMSAETAAQSPNTSASSGPVTTIAPAPVNYNSGISNTITVNSNEKVTVIPDIAEVVYAVRTQSKAAADCQKKNTEDINKVIELLKGLGIKDTSIQTSDYNMYPIYDYSSNTQKITGYEAVSSLTVSDIPIANLGDILTKSVSTGVNTIQSVTYESSKYDEGYQEALKLAMGTALTKAQALAEAGNCSLGGVVGVQENSNYTAARYTDNALGNQMMAKQEASLSMDSASPEIMPGQIEVQVNITVQYQIQ